MDSSHVEKQYILSYNDRIFVINHNTKLLIDIVQSSDRASEMVENFRGILHSDLSLMNLNSSYPRSLSPFFLTAKRNPRYVLFFSRRRLLARLELQRLVVCSSRCSHTSYITSYWRLISFCSWFSCSPLEKNT